MQPDSSQKNRNPLVRLVVLFAGMLAFACWVWANGSKFISGSDEAVRFVVCSGIALTLLIRRREKWSDSTNDSVLLFLAVGGASLSIIGMIASIHQFSWIGAVLLLYVCLRWGLPLAIAANATLACFMLYWAHPFPSQFEWPLHAIMQRMSVTGSEWLLHVTNVPAWADGTVIHGIFGTFDVPHACSGMRTASTVVICAIGTSILFKLGWRRATILSLLGLGQTLSLNIIRISVMVANANVATSETSVEFLHDTTGILLLIAILLVQGEAALWYWSFFANRRARTGIGRPLPRVTYIIIAALILFVIGVVTLEFGKRDNLHQAEMIGRVAKAMITEDTTTADRASLEARRLDPDSHRYRIIRAGVLRQQGKPDEVLEILEPFAKQNSNMEVLALRLWALNARGERDAVRDQFESLAPSVIKHPELAMVAAEFAVSNGMLDDVLKHLPNAAKYPHLASRVRRFYVYLASHEQWRMITEIDSAVPYTDTEELLLGVTASLIVDNIDAASEILNRNRALWEHDLMFAGHLLVLAEREPSREWGECYATCVKPHIEKMDADSLYGHIGPLFLLEQVELADKVYERLKLIDPQHPGVSLAPARHPELMEEGEDRSGYLEAAIAAFEQRRAEGKASPSLMMSYADALMMSGDADGASTMLESLRENDPNLSVKVLSRQVILYRETGRWQDAYESIRNVRESGLFPDRLTVNDLIEILMGMGHPFYALTVAQQTLYKTPGWPGIRRSVVNLLASAGHHEEALFVISQGSIALSEGHVRLYESTGRYKKSYAIRQRLGLPELIHERNPSWILPPAEATVEPPVIQPITPDMQLKQISQLQKQIEIDSSPFLKSIHQLTLSWHKGDGGAESHKLWMDAGRDPFERSVALHTLALLQAQDKAYAAAASTIELALNETPRSAVLWRLAVAFSSGNATVVDRACRTCPEDSELWLARLVATHRTGTGDLREILDQACKHPRYSPGTLVRAASFLLQVQRPKLAERAVLQALRQDHDYVPAYLVGIHSSRLCGDISTAIKRASSAASLAPNPWPFHRTAAMLQMAMSGSDPSVIPTLEALRNKFPSEREWHVRLGCIYMEHEDAERAWRVLGPVVTEDATGLPATVVTRAAEAARLTGHQSVAVKLLRDIYAIEPTNQRVLNNLVYTLAQQEQSKGEALQLVPELLKLGDNASTLDTVAFTLDATGSSDKALPHIEKALEQVADLPVPDCTGYYITAAEINLHLGQINEAKAIVERLIDGTGPVIRNEPRVRKILSRLE